MLRTPHSTAQAFVDARDAGPIYVTHFTLLLGLATPMWLAAALPPSSSPAVGTLQRALCGLSGIMVIGFGDTAASVVGRTWGRVPIYNGSHKTREGTLAGMVCTLVAWAAVLGMCACCTHQAALWPTARQWLSLAAATTWACMLEACTSQLDNILIPLFYLPHALLAA